MRIRFILKCRQLLLRGQQATDTGEYKLVSTSDPKSINLSFMFMNLSTIGCKEDLKVKKILLLNIGFWYILLQKLIRDFIHYIFYWSK